MGGFDTMITDKTRNILIESAWWDPATVRKMAKRHGLHTDASHRFERGADFESTVRLDRSRCGTDSAIPAAANWLAMRSTWSLGRLDQAPDRARPDGGRTAFWAKIFSAAGDRAHSGAAWLLHCCPNAGRRRIRQSTIPCWRLDVEREIDLIEEIARLHGYDKFPEHAARIRRSGDRTADAQQRIASCALPAGAGLRRSRLADVHLAGRCEDVSRAAIRWSWRIR